MSKPAPLIFEALGFKDDDRTTLSVIDRLWRELKLLARGDKHRAGARIPKTLSVSADPLPENIDIANVVTVNNVVLPKNQDATVWGTCKFWVEFHRFAGRYNGSKLGLGPQEGAIGRDLLNEEVGVTGEFSVGEDNLKRDGMGTVACCDDAGIALKMGRVPKWNRGLAIEPKELSLPA